MIANVVSETGRALLTVFGEMQSHRTLIRSYLLLF
jgi:hypothetical protein